MTHEGQHQDGSEIRQVGNENPDFLFSEALRNDSIKALKPDSLDTHVMFTKYELSRIAVHYAQKKPPETAHSSLYFLPRIHDVHPTVQNPLYDELVGMGAKLEYQCSTLSQSLLAAAGVKPYIAPGY